VKCWDSVWSALFLNCDTSYFLFWW